MRIAALYDIHGNLPALEAVLAHVQQESVDMIVVGGDVVAGPMPKEVLACLQTIDTPIQFIHGNAESEVLRYVAGQPVNGLAPQKVVEWVARQLTPEQLQFIGTWLATYQLEMDVWGEIIFCHATPHNDTDVFTQRTSDATLEALFKNVTASLVVCGHTHMQMDRTVNHIRILNAGSIGMPFIEMGACWLLIDDDIQFKRTFYDLQEAANRIRHSTYPNVEQFIQNNLLEVPVETAVFALLTQLEAQNSIGSN